MGRKARFNPVLDGPETFAANKPLLQFLISGKSQSQFVPHELEGGPDEGGGDDVVDEEGAVVGQEDALPAELVLPAVVPNHGLEERPADRDRGRRKKRSYQL